MNEDIEMMSKEIELIRDRILNNSPFTMSSNINSDGITPVRKKRLTNQPPIKQVELSFSDDGYQEDSD